MSTVKIDNQDQFFELFKQKEKAVIVRFSAEWCGPCKSIAPIFTELADKFKDNLIVLNVDVEENQELASIFRVRSLPSVVSSYNGDVVEANLGAQRSEIYLKMAQNAIDKIS